MAKSKDTYPVSCDDLWAAVKDTLANPGNYGVLAMDDAAQTAMFNITGATRVRINSVDLAAKDGGCELKVTTKDSGFGNEDEGAFRKRVAKSLQKIQAARPAAPGKPAGAAPGMR